MPQLRQEPEGQHNGCGTCKCSKEQVAGKEPQRSEQMTEVLCERLKDGGFSPGPGAVALRAAIMACGVPNGGLRLSPKVS